MGSCPTFYPTDSFGAVSNSSGKIILVNATLLPDFSDIIGNRHKNPFFQFYRYFLIVIMQNNVSNKKEVFDEMKNLIWQLYYIDA